MRLEDVLPELRNGKMIRRRKWESFGSFVAMNEGFVKHGRTLKNGEHAFPWKGSKDSHIFSSDDVLAADWEVVEEAECRFAHVDPFDGGLRCCNRKSEWITEWCPYHKCEWFEARNED